MKAKGLLSLMTTEQLVDRFAEIGVEQYEAELDRKIAQYNRLYSEMERLAEELRVRPGDQRRALQEQPQAADARDMLRAVVEGRYIPR